MNKLKHWKKKNNNNNNKAAYTLAFILGALVLTYLPVIITSVVTTYGKGISLPVINILWSWSLTFITLGSLCNPIVYFWRIKKLRHTFLEILHLNQPHNNSPEMEMQVITRNRCQVAPTPLAALSQAMAGAKQEPTVSALSITHPGAELRN